jgi:hypothetical protein
MARQRHRDAVLCRTPRSWLLTVDVLIARIQRMIHLDDQPERRDSENYCAGSCLCAMKLETPAERPAAATVSTVDARMARCIQRAEAGEADAQCDLGIAHATGDAGGPASLTTAVSWFRRAAAQVRRDRHSSVSFARRSSRLCPREERSTAQDAVGHGLTRGRRGRSRLLTRIDGLQRWRRPCSGRIERCVHTTHHRCGPVPRLLTWVPFAECRVTLEDSTTSPGATTRAKECLWTPPRLRNCTSPQVSGVPPPQ